MIQFTATPSSIGIYGAGSGTSTIHWETDEGYNGIVYVRIDNGPEEKLGGSQDRGARRGNLPLALNLGQVARLSLRRVDNGVEIASLQVDTYDVRAELAGGFSQAYFPNLRPQLITNLVVTPGVDTVRVRFRTTRPTIPTVGLFGPDNVYVDGRMPLFAGLQTLHQFEFGMDKPLALGAKHTLHIEAFGATGDATSPRKVIRQVEFVSGTRSADVSFETIKVRNDSDSGGDGEIAFAFAVGDRGTGEKIGDHVYFPASGYLEISDDDPALAVGVTIPLPSAPRVIWAQVNGSDDDSSSWPLDGLRFLLPPEFKGEGGSYRDQYSSENVDLAVSVDLGDEPGRFAIPLEMETGPFPFEFAVSGHVFVNAEAGRVNLTKSGKLRFPPSASAFLTEPGDAMKVRTGGTSRHIAYGADQAVHISEGSRSRASPDGGSRVALPVAGTVSVSRGPDERLWIHALNAEGAVFELQPGSTSGKGEDWRSLGGNLREVHPLPGMAGPVLAGIGRDGNLYALNEEEKSSQWAMIAKGDFTTLTAVALPGGPVGIMASDGDRTVTFLERHEKGWRHHALSGVIGGKSAIQGLAVALSCESPGKGREALPTLHVAALDDDWNVHLFRWAGFPSDSPASNWEELGSVQSLVSAGDDNVRPGEKPAAPRTRNKAEMAPEPTPA